MFFYNFEKLTLHFKLTFSKSQNNNQFNAVDNRVVISQFTCILLEF